ncbi:MAG: phosphocholine cytidylyltransferase family protein [Bacteroidales bacterium]|nr:phosphocholine cytidylyltransferase family protein [Bacteroidales bacterium]
MKALILAAGTASRLRPLTNDTPKCLLRVGQRSLLQRSMDALIQNDIRQFVIVTGYLHEKIEQFVSQQYGDSIQVSFIHNDIFASTNNIYSLWLARPSVEGEDVLLLDSDLLYDPQIITRILAEDALNVLTLIRHPLGEEEMKVVTASSRNHAKGVTSDTILEISKTCNPDEAAGESLGIEKMCPAYSRCLYSELDKMMNQEHLENKFYELAFERLIPQGHTFSVLDVTDLFSCELDTVEDFENAKQKIPASLY